MMLTGYPVNRVFGPIKPNMTIMVNKTIYEELKANKRLNELFTMNVKRMGRGPYIYRVHFEERKNDERIEED